jgi:hypothetical protein
VLRLGFALRWGIFSISLYFSPIGAYVKNFSRKFFRGIKFRSYILGIVLCKRYSNRSASLKKVPFLTGISITATSKHRKGSCAVGLPLSLRFNSNILFVSFGVTANELDDLVRTWFIDLRFS